MIFSLFRKSTFALFLILIAWAPWLVPAAYSAVWQWSETASTNASVDPTINWREGQPPSSINDSARAMMARLAEYRDDISGAVATTGTSTAYTASTNQGICTSSTAPVDGQMIAITPNVTNGIQPTLTVDSCVAIAIDSSPGNWIGAGVMVAGTPYSLKYSSANTAWMLRDFYGNPYNTPLGGFLISSIAAPPNSNFITPAGQCVSTTTYNAYWLALGQPASGACPGGQFAVVDVRGRNMTMVDQPPGFSAAGRLTASSTGCGSAFNSFGLTCLNASQSHTLVANEIPAITSTVSVSGTLSGTTSSVVLSEVGGLSTPGGGFAFSGAGTVGSASVTVSGGLGGTSTSNNTGGSAHSVVNPNVAVYVYLRVI